MGIGSDFIETLLQLRADGHISAPSAIMEIGAQQLSNEFLRAQSAVDRIGKTFGVTGRFVLPSPNESHVVHGNLEHLNETAPMARSFFEWLGFRYACVDIDGSPGSIPLDLNYDDVPPGERGNYQLVTNLGTTEHVANQLNAFKIIHELTAVDGIMIHHVPAQGMYNHGLVNYNPKFFWMLARSNEYKFVQLNYLSSTVSYSLPQNIVDSVAPFNPDITARAESCRAADSMLLVILQKRFDLPYVAPLDVATGTQSDNAVLTERYWTVFEPDRLRRILSQT